MTDSSIGVAVIGAGMAGRSHAAGYRGASTLYDGGLPDVRLVANEENVGYTRANNQGIAVARGRYLLLVNADAFVARGACDRLLAAIESDPGIAVAGPRLVFGNGSSGNW